jgi:hypothetical protein
MTVSDTLQYTKWSHSLNKPLKKAALLLTFQFIMNVKALQN